MKHTYTSVFIVKMFVGSLHLIDEGKLKSMIYRPASWSHALSYRNKFNSIYWLQNVVIAEKPFKSHEIGVRELIESINNVGIHFSPTRVKSRFENVDRGRSNNESW